MFFHFQRTLLMLGFVFHTPSFSLTFFLIVLVPMKTWSQLTNLKSLDLSRIRFSIENGDDSEVEEDFLIENTEIKQLTNLQTLKLGSFPKFSKDSLQHLVKLKKLYFPVLDYFDPSHSFGKNLELLGSFPELQLVKLPMLSVPIRKTEFQQNYPHVRFHWLTGKDYDSYYEGEFNEDGLRHGKGFYLCLSAISRFSYEGEFFEDQYSGQGKLSFIDEDLGYEGGFKNGSFEGEGTFFVKKPPKALSPSSPFYSLRKILYSYFPYEQIECQANFTNGTPSGIPTVIVLDSQGRERTVL